jgi:hypothetical protein
VDLHRGHPGQLFDFEKNPVRKRDPPPRAAGRNLDPLCELVGQQVYATVIAVTPVT